MGAREKVRWTLRGLAAHLRRLVDGRDEAVRVEVVDVGEVVKDDRDVEDDPEDDCWVALGQPHEVHPGKEEHARKKAVYRGPRSDRAISMGIPAAHWARKLLSQNSGNPPPPLKYREKDTPKARVTSEIHSEMKTYWRMGTTRRTARRLERVSFDSSGCRALKAKREIKSAGGRQVQLSETREERQAEGKRGRTGEDEEVQQPDSRRRDPRKLVDGAKVPRRLAERSTENARERRLVDGAVRGVAQAAEPGRDLRDKRRRSGGDDVVVDQPSDAWRDPLVHRLKVASLGVVKRKRARAHVRGLSCSADELFER